MNRIKPPIWPPGFLSPASACELFATNGNNAEFFAHIGSMQMAFQYALSVNLKMQSSPTL